MSALKFTGELTYLGTTDMLRNKGKSAGLSRRIQCHNRNRASAAPTASPTALGVEVRVQAKPTCARCGASFTPHRSNPTQRFCSRQCGVTAAHDANRGTGTPWRERFWRFVPDPRPDGCWEWQGTRRRDGYGVLMVSKTPYRTMGAHRASATIHHGPIPEGMKVLHSCDNPPCVNPAHLSIGTQRENVEDMMRKGRWGGAQGEASNLSKFPREVIDEVLRIKADEGLSNRLIGERVGMSKAHVRRIVNGQARRVA